MTLVGPYPVDHDGSVVRELYRVCLYGPLRRFGVLYSSSFPNTAPTFNAISRHRCLVASTPLDRLFAALFDDLAARRNMNCFPNVVYW